MAASRGTRERNLLVVDVGNTSTAVGLWRNGKVSRVAHIDGAFADVAARITSLASDLQSKAANLSAICPWPGRPRPGNWKEPPSITQGEDALSTWLGVPKLAAADLRPVVAYASVVPKKDAKFKALFRRLGLRMIAVDAASFAVYGKTVGLTLDYPKPNEIGADRFADAAGAYERFGSPVLIMDFGTALTAAVVTRDRVWRGGVIAPGFPLMRDYLFERTAKLPRMKMGGRTPKIGRSTEEAMRFGALVGYRGMVREIVMELKRNFHEDFRLVATGGFARWVLRNMDLPFVVDPTLTLYGAGLIAAKSL